MRYSDRVSTPETTAAGDDTVVRPRRERQTETVLPSSGVLGRYLVIEELGKGGMGVVVRAYDPKLQREVALKMLRHDMMSEEARIRMIREARAMAKLNHPNVVAIYDVSLEDDAIALAMEYVRGKTLKQWLRGSGRSATEIVAAFVQAGRGLAAAHAEGLLHRDFKPANALVADAEDGRLRVKVTDFGIARTDALPDLPPIAEHDIDAFISRSDYTDTGALTEAGTVMGTPRYMAPEQHCGDPLGPATDQYAFCVALWEALVGEVPFPTDAMVAEKRRGPPPWPRAIAAPPGVAAAIRRGLAPAPADRWPDMAQLLDALGAHRRRGNSRSSIVAVAGVLALGVAGWSVLRDRGAERCTGAEAQLAEVWSVERRAEVETALLATNVTYAPALWERIGPRLDAYADVWIDMHTDACTATSVRGEQSAAVLDLRMGCLHAARRDLQAALTLLARPDAEVLSKAHVLVDELPELSRCADVDALQKDVPPPDPSEADAVAAIETTLAEARALSRAGKVKAAESALVDAEAELADVDYLPVAVGVTQERAVVANELGDYDAAEAGFHRAIELAGRAGAWAAMAEAAGGLATVIALAHARSNEALVYIEFGQVMAERSSDPQLVSGIHNARAVVLHTLGKYAESEAEFRRALQIRSDAFGPDHLSVATLRGNLAIVLHHLGRYAEAEAEQRAVMRIREVSLGPEHPDLASSHHNLAATLYAEAKPDEAIAHYREALRLWEQAFGPDFPDLTKSRSNLGNVLNGQGRYVEAEAILRDVLRSIETNYGADHPESAPTRTNLANALLGQSRWDDAEAEYRAVLQLHERLRGAGHPDVAHAHSNIGNLLSATNRPVEAEAEFRRAIGLYETSVGGDHDDALLGHAHLGAALSSQGRFAEAEVELRGALTGLEAKMGADHPNVAITRARLAVALEGLERFTEAEAEHRRALAILERGSADQPDLVDERLRFGAFLRARGELDEARAQLERAWVALAKSPRMVERGETAFELARVSWATGERSRARSLAVESERAYEAAGAPWRDRHDAVEAWLRAPQ